MTTLAATTLIIEISRRASRLPSVSIFQAAFRVEQARLLGLHPALGDEVLDELLVGELRAEGLALVGAAAHHLDRALAGADRAHAVVDPAGAEAVLGDHEAGAARAEQVRHRHAAVLVADLAVARPLVVAHHRDRADQVEARGVGRDDDHARPRVGCGVGVGDDHHDRDVGADGARGEPLVAVDDPVAVARRARPGSAASSGRSRRPRARSSRSSVRMSPSSSGSSQRDFCSSVPCSARISMLPVSGAAQLKAIGATTGLRPISSQSIPYSQFVRPAPCSSSGRNRFQRPSARAFSRMSTMISG